MLIAFDSVEQAVAARDSPGYKAALDALGDGAVRDIRIVEGLRAPQRDTTLPVMAGLVPAVCARTCRGRWPARGRQ